MKAKTLFSLVVRTQDAVRELLRSNDPDVLRNCGAALAPTTEHDSDLILMGPRGRTIAEYDIWSSEWRAAA